MAKRILEQRFEFSIVGIAVAIVGFVAVAFLGMVAFGNVVTHTQRGGTKAGALGEFAVTLASLPVELKKISDNYLELRPDPHPGKSGFSFVQPAGSGQPYGHLLLSRYDGDLQRPVVELWDLDARQLVHRWEPDIDAIMAQADLKSEQVDLARDKRASRFLIRHPYLTEDGGLIFQGHSPLVKVDRCGRPVWMNDGDIFHHALERDAAGTYWTAAMQEPATLKGMNPKAFADDSIAEVDGDGQLLSLASVSQILIENGYRHFVLGGPEYTNDPIHLNDVQPVPGDGPFWKAGDLFLSLRSHSLIVLYRPSTGKVIWLQQGPWMRQHDVDVLDDHRISVFSNNSGAFWRSDKSLEPSDVMIHDLASGETTSPWKAGLAALDLRTMTEGLQTVLPDGRLFVEEQNRGRIVMVDSDGALLWDYVNRAEGGSVFRLGWSRLLPAGEADAIAAELAQTDCGTE